MAAWNKENSLGMHVSYTCFVADGQKYNTGQDMEPANDNDIGAGKVARWYGKALANENDATCH